MSADGCIPRCSTDVGYRDDDVVIPYRQETPVGLADTGAGVGADYGSVARRFTETSDLECSTN